MDMFLESLHPEPDQDANLVSQLLAIINAYHEFHQYCIFLHQSHEAIVLQAELDQGTFDGISMSGRCLVNRSEQIEQRLNEVLAVVKGEA
ncbi:hypothetical protein ACFL2V_20450 [Pseudomonadota bacterium]